MVQIGDWRIVEADARNLALEHRHAATRPGKGDGANVGEVSWHRTGNYFQAVPAAVEFVMRAELARRAGDPSVTMTCEDFLREERALLAEFREWLSASPSNSWTPARE